MVNNGFNPDKVTTDIAVRSLCSVGLVDEAIESPLDSYTFNHLVKQLCMSKLCLLFMVLLMKCVVAVARSQILLLILS